MKPHQLRVVIEKAELDIKIVALKEFVENSPIFPTLPVAEQDRLRFQFLHMQAYSDVLGERMEQFPKGESN